MMLYLCRHGIAEDAAPSDDARALTREGVKKFREAARGFVRLEPAVTHILTSSLVRARQTAEILADVLADARLSAEPRVSCALAPPGDLRMLLSEIRDLAACRSVVAVGHEPTLSRWVGQLCFGATGSCEMKKGAIAGIELDAAMRHGHLMFLLQPAQLRGLA